MSQKASCKIGQLQFRQSFQGPKQVAARPRQVVSLAPKVRIPISRLALLLWTNPLAAKETSANVLKEFPPIS